MRNNVIGGLLIVVLLSNPAVTKAESVGLQVLNGLSTYQKVVFVIDKEEDEIDRTISEEIDRLFDEMSRNTNMINILLRDKKNAMNQIQTALNAKIAAKERLTKEQMDNYKIFCDYAEGKNYDIMAYLNQIDSKKDLKTAERELLHTKTDFAKVYNELDSLVSSQVSLITTINDFRSEAVKMVDALA